MAVAARVLDTPTGGRVVALMTPEGVPFRLGLASRTDRIAAFLIDALVIVVVVILVLVAAMLLEGAVEGIGLGVAFSMIAIFLLRNFYFAGCELLLQGATLGKKVLRLRVVDARGGPLRAEAVFARNLTREIEIFVPLVLLIAPQAIWPGSSGWLRLIAVLWGLVFALLPFFNREHRRVGDFVGGTLVVKRPEARLGRDLTQAPRSKAARKATYTFTPEQLSKYGVYELQVLEELLRDRTRGSRRTMASVCERIQRKIDWPRDQRKVDHDAFLRDFYAAQRAALETGLLFGRRKERKDDPPAARLQPPK